MADDHEILVSAKEYRQLLRDAEVLAALYRAGVDNWDWYDAALEDAGIADD